MRIVCTDCNVTTEINGVHARIGHAIVTEYTRTCMGSCNGGFRADTESSIECSDDACRMGERPCTEHACYFAAEGDCTALSPAAAEWQAAQDAPVDGDRIVTARPAHLGSEEAYAEVAQVKGQTCDWDDLREISDACALTIASWWQGPRKGDGAAFAELSTTGSVNADDLAQEIARAYDSAGITRADRDALDCLGTWAIHRASRA